MKVLTVVGNRPQFIKAAPLSLALRKAGIEEVSLHTGQHYDRTMSAVFYDELALPEPLFSLDLRSADTALMQPEILAALRRSLDEMFPNKPLTSRDQIRASERQSKSIILHHYMDRHDFDLERLSKCCHHYPQIDGKIMTACGFNMFHRGAAKGPETPRATFGRAPFSLPVIQ